MAIPVPETVAWFDLSTSAHGHAWHILLPRRRAEFARQITFRKARKATLGSTQTRRKGQI
ncbi:protein of unknown function (plasmid) [Pararobbsia alpina]